MSTIPPAGFCQHLLVYSLEDGRGYLAHKLGVGGIGEQYKAGMKALSTYTKYRIGCAYVGEFLHSQSLPRR